MLSLNDVTFFQAGEEDLETSWGEVVIMEAVATLAEVSCICIPVNNCLFLLTSFDGVGKHLNCTCRVKTDCSASSTQGDVMFCML